jgi:hypothetical protein
MPSTARELPMRAKLLRDSEEPKWDISKTANADPKRLKLRSETEEPKFT